MSHEPSEFTASTEPVYQAVSKPILFVWYRALIRRPTRSSVPAIGGGVGVGVATPAMSRARLQEGV